MINCLILTVCQLVYGYFMPQDYGIEFFVYSYLHFLCSRLRVVVFLAHSPIE